MLDWLIALWPLYVICAPFHLYLILTRNIRKEIRVARIIRVLHKKRTRLRPDLSCHSSS